MVCRRFPLIMHESWASTWLLPALVACGRQLVRSSSVENQTRFCSLKSVLILNCDLEYCQRHDAVTGVSRK